MQPMTMPIIMAVSSPSSSSAGGGAGPEGDEVPMGMLVGALVGMGVGGGSTTTVAKVVDCFTTGLEIVTPLLASDATIALAKASSNRPALSLRVCITAAALAARAGGNLMR